MRMSLEAEAHSKLFSVENFCEGEKHNGFTFSKTIVGFFAYSKEKCSKDTSGEFCIDDFLFNFIFDYPCVLSLFSPL